MREVRPSDMDAVQRIENDCFPVAWSRASLVQGMRQEKAIFLVAEIDRTVVGYALTWVVLDEAHLLKIAVDPGHQERGVGKLLLERTIEDTLARDGRLIYLEVREANAPALALYDGFGFRPIGVRREYYPETKEDATVMIKYLKAP